MAKSWIGAALMAAALGACAGGWGRGALAVDPARVTMLEGDTVRLRAVGGAGPERVWTSTDTTVVRVIEPGRIVGVSAGRATVRAASGDEEAVARVYVDRAVLVGAGDIAVCGYEADEATANLLDDIGGVIWTAGDNAYPSGSASNFAECYDPTWGRHRERTRPTPGNHEYRSAGAGPYFDYFGDAAGEPGKGWYTYHYGGWLVLALNSNFSYLSDERVEEQLDWLDNVLAGDSARCSAAYFHHPLVSSGSHGNNVDEYDDENVKPIWDRLYAAGVDVVMVGHDHHYERFAPLDPEGQLDRSHGIRQFLVGTGGGALRGRGHELHPNSELFFNRTHGVLELVLHEDGYDWQFVAIDGRGVDSGSDSCHGPPGAPPQGEPVEDPPGGQAEG